MSRLSRVEEKAVARYVDGEMSPTEREAFERRAAGEPRLQAGLTAALDQSQLLRSATEPTVRPSSRFAVSVLEEVRSQPPRTDLVRFTENENLLGEALRHARRLLAAAVILFSLSSLFTFDLLGPTDRDQLSASDLQEEMDQLDQKVLELKKARQRR